ncbi:hypothetical protein TSAR_005155 [Trichomalopsis sarcophagae]|uniref:Protein MMS22-like n=1 Tax=Trichomalopsis sarcophagae TaxID=543379 RepID=A0A232FFD6_9HYME|nr:hypothetical protein TSAR_005155 [Trichomalopsis sarcophagae]
MSKGTFNCSGKVNLHDWQLNSSSLFMQKDLHNVLHEKPPLNSVFKVFECELPGIDILMNLKHYVRCMESNLKKLCRFEKIPVLGKLPATNEEIDFFVIRKVVCEFLYNLRSYIKSIREDNFTIRDVGDESEKDFEDLLDTMQRFLGRLHCIPDSTFLYAPSNVGNKSNQPEYHLYHSHLDLRWLLTTIIYIKSNSWHESESNNEHLENIIFSALADLIYISMKIFVTIPNTDLHTRTPYSCSCVRELWLMLQILADSLFTKEKCKMFWEFLNSILDQLFPNEYRSTSKLQNINLPDCKNSEVFCIWLIYHLTLLYGYADDGVYSNKPSTRMTEKQISCSMAQVVKIMKIYINKGGKDGAREEVDDELCVIIPLVHVLSCEWWSPQVQIISLLWECFHRRLDQPFLLQTRGPWSTSSEKKTPMDILEQIKSRIKNTNHEINHESSFGLFLRLLGKFLEKHYSRSEAKVWNQIKGRIYSRFSQNKLQDYTESGIYNFISLFLTLAVTTDTVDVCSAMVNLLPSTIDWSDPSNSKKYCLIWKSKLAVLLLYNDCKYSFKDIAESYTETANAISCRKDEFSRSMMVWFIDVLRITLMQSEDFGRHEHAFLGGWIDRYLLESAPNKVGVLTSTLLKVFEKCNDLLSSNTMGSTLMLNSLWQHVASRVRQMVTNCDLSTDFYENPTKLAVAFTLEACRDPSTAKKYRHSAVSLFQHFTMSVIIKDIRITQLYLTAILQNEIALETLRKEIANFNTLCIQAWVKCNILNCEINSDKHFLKNYISHLPEIKSILDSERDINEFRNSNEPIIHFFMVISKKRTTLKAEQCSSFDATCRSYLHNLDKWALQLINEENKDTKLSFWIYRCIGTVIFCCSPVLYVKNQPSNMLRVLINKVALPPEQPAQPHLVHLAQRIFHMIILGIENLNVKADISLQTMIRELFERYLPLLITVEASNENAFKVADSLSKCFLEAKPNFVRSILDMLAANFVTICGSNSTHKHCYLVMLLLRNLIRAGKIYSIDVLDSIVSVSASSIFNCYMRVHDHHPHKQQTIDFLKDVSLNSYYKENLSLREKLNEIVWNALNKYVQTNSKVSFEFVSSISKINIELLKYIYPRIKQIVSECEKNKLPNAAALRYQEYQLLSLAS